MNRPDLIFPYPMLTIGPFAIAIFAVLVVLGRVLWVRLNCRDQAGTQR